MESAYSLASSELAMIRKENDEILLKREAEIRAKDKEYAEVEAVLKGAGVALSRCVLGGSENFEKVKARIMEAQNKKVEILEKNGYPKNYLDEIFSCKNCHDTGFDGDGRRCECLNKLIFKYIGLNSNLTEVMREQTFESFSESIFENQPDVSGHKVLDIINSAKSKAIGFSNDFEKTGRNLFMYGDAGTGKTFMSSCIANRVLQRGFTVYYQSAFKLLDMLEKIKFGRYDESELSKAEYEAKYVYEADLLIIDDVGTEFVSAYSSAALFDIINSRIINKKSTIISSNLGPSKISEIYGTRLASRITGEFEPMRFIGVDLRRIKYGY